MTQEQKGVIFKMLAKIFAMYVML